ncbi:MAG: response regulator transcription factor [Dehalococcoidales bacterium]|nr:response regulator transcription factor [Dehalococcoidales bacterium]
MKILIVEDDIRLAGVIRKGLDEEGYTVSVSYDGNEGLSSAVNNRPDLIVLDIVLPGKNGLDICRELRQQKTASKILMLSCKGTVAERVQGLDAGADDYLIKPFEFSELYARIRALLRRDTGASSILTVQNLTLNPAGKEVRLDGQLVLLTRTEYRLLHFLMLHQGEIISKNMLESQVWTSSSSPESNLIEVNIGRLRDKLGGRGKDSIIRTVRGFGYMVGPEC